MQSKYKAKCKTFFYNWKLRIFGTFIEKDLIVWDEATTVKISRYIYRGKIWCIEKIIKKKI